MASQEDPDYAGVVDAFNSLYAHNKLSNTAYILAFLVFDWLVGLRWEMSLFWTGASIGATTLYATTRYMTLLDNVIFLIQFSQLSDEVSQFPAFFFLCTQLVWTTFVLSFFTSLPLLLLAVLRVYALTRHTLLATITFLILSVPVACTVVPYTFSAIGLVIPIIGCMEADLTPVDLYTRYLYSLAGDVLLLVVTYWTSPQRGNILGWLKNGGKTLSSVMLYNGLIYFVALTVLDTLHLVFSVLAIEDLGGTSIIGILRDPMASVLVSRFLLDLQDAHRRSVMLDSRRPVSTVCSVEERTLSFARMTGPLSATIDDDMDDDFGGLGRDEGDLDSADWAMEDDDGLGDSVNDLKV
ncbi:hypothetical protein LXA43DRAFT_891607 [Ganoderma leucocontextum]|nr:hypothetical protein LXA43DRAFT_891607 [Ganoderma leucocontextum]